MPVVKRETSTGTIFINGGFDEFTGATVVDTSLIFWVDAAQSTSYSGSGNSWINLANVSGYTGTRTFSAGNTAIFTSAEGGYFDYASANVQATVGSLNTFGFSLPANPIPTTGSFTISALIQRNSATTPLGDREAVFSNTGSADGYRFGYDQSGYPYYLIGGVSGVGYQEGTLGTTVLTDGRWHLLTIVYDRAAQLGSYKIYGYVDNILSGSATITAGAGGNVAFTNSTTSIGNGGCCRAFGGKISTVFAYGRALSANEVSQNFNALRRRYGI